MKKLVFLFLVIITFYLVEATADVGKVTVVLLDESGSPLPSEVLDKLFFNVSGHIIDYSLFVKNFNDSVLNNTTIMYKFFNKTHKVNFATKKINNNITELRISVMNLGSLNLSYLNMTLSLDFIPYTSNLSSVLRDPAFSPVSFRIKSPCIENKSFYLTINQSKVLVEKDIAYIPLCLIKNRTNPWIIELLYLNDTLISFVLSSNISHTIRIPIIVVPEALNLSKILKIDKRCNESIILNCSKFKAFGRAPDQVLRAERRQAYPDSDACQLHVISPLKPYSCGGTLKEIIGYCSIELYNLEFILLQQEIINNLSLILNSTVIDLKNQNICISKGNYEVKLLYNYYGVIFKLYDKVIFLNNSKRLDFILNLSDIRIEVMSKCNPKILVNNVEVPIEGDTKDEFVLKAFPQTGANITVTACDTGLHLEVLPNSSLKFKLLAEPKKVIKIEQENLNLIGFYTIIFLLAFQLVILIILLREYRFR